MALDLLSELLEQLQADPARTLELVDLLTPHLQKPAAVVREVTVSQAAVIAGVSEKTIRRSIDSGDLAAHRIGRALRINEQALTDFLNARPVHRGPRPRRQAPRRPTPGSEAVAHAFRMLDSKC